MKKFFGAIVLLTIVIACSNKNAEYNNEAYLMHSNFQNNLSELSEKLSNDSITNDSAKHFIAQTKLLCDTILLNFNKIKVPEKAKEFNAAIASLFAQQIAGLDIRRRLYDDSEPGKEFSVLQDSLDMSEFKVDSMDAKIKELQTAFAKANNFKLN